MSNIFIIEDDITLRKELGILLETYGYSCLWSDDYKNMVSTVLKSKADLLLLDINLPYIDGYHICREIRKVSDLPIIVVTSRRGDMDELMSMNLGADDFITKPYNTQILLARITAVLKRTACENTTDVLKHNDIILFLSRSTVKYGNNEIELTKNELRILSVLIRSHGRIVSRDELMDELWQSDEFVDDNTLTVNVNRLRKKLEEIGATKYISTKRGQGYIV